MLQEFPDVPKTGAADADGMRSFSLPDCELGEGWWAAHTNEASRPVRSDQGLPQHRLVHTTRSAVAAEAWGLLEDVLHLEPGSTQQIPTVKTSSVKVLFETFKRLLSA